MWKPVSLQKPCYWMCSDVYIISKSKLYLWKISMDLDLRKQMIVWLFFSVTKLGFSGKVEKFWNIAANQI